MANAIVIAVIVALAALAVRKIRRERLLGHCGGDCSSCAMNCAKRSRESEG